MEQHRRLGNIPYKDPSDLIYAIKDLDYVPARLKEMSKGEYLVMR
jgi:hypothetical protein